MLTDGSNIAELIRLVFTLCRLELRGPHVVESDDVGLAALMPWGATVRLPGVSLRLHGV